MDLYPTVTIESAHLDSEVGGFSFKGSGITLGRCGTVPLPDGWMLGRRECGRCGGSGDYHDPSCDGGCTAQDRQWDGWCGTCPSCHGAGGFPVLLRPCTAQCNNGVFEDGSPCGCVAGLVEVTWEGSDE